MSGDCSKRKIPNFIVDLLISHVLLPDKAIDRPPLPEPVQELLQSWRRGLGGLQAASGSGPLAARLRYPTCKTDGAVRSRIWSTSASGRPTSRIQEKVRSYDSNDSSTGKSLPGRMCSAPNAFQAHVSAACEPWPTVS